jgi:hypothetical protein
MLFLGDSTSAQLTAAVHNYVSWGSGGCAAQLTHVTADTLVRRKFGASNRGCMWLDCLQELPAPPGVLVLNAGPHIHSEEGMADVLSTVRNQFLERRVPGGALAGTQLIWATSLGGGCIPARQPLLPRNALPASEPEYGRRLSRTQKTYNYARMECWDSHAAEFWAGIPGAAVLDLMPLWLRPDGRVDSGGDKLTNCVHMCSPGPLRFAARRLQRLLESGRTT